MNYRQYQFIRARREHSDDIMDIIGAAVSRMLAEGKRQWSRGYPAECHILNDIAQGNGYILTDRSGKPAAYGAVIAGDEPAYAHIRGTGWISEGTYAVLHRMAVAPGLQRHGLAMQFLSEAERMAKELGARSFRLDTNFDNSRMLALIRKAGYTYCGTVRYESGERMAFEKIL